MTHLLKRGEGDSRLNSCPPRLKTWATRAKKGFEHKTVLPYEGDIGHIQETTRFRIVLRIKLMNPVAVAQPCLTACASARA